MRQHRPPPAIAPVAAPVAIALAATFIGARSMQLRTAGALCEGANPPRRQC